MIMLQRLISRGQCSDWERQFFSHTFNTLSSSGEGKFDKLEGWMVTSIEVEFGPFLGGGGLYVLGSISHASDLTLTLSVERCTKAPGTALRLLSKY